MTPPNESPAALLPCYGCGSAPQVEQYKHVSGWGIRCVNDDCSRQPGVEHWGSFQDCAAAWNAENWTTKPASPAPAAILEPLPQWLLNLIGEYGHERTNGSIVEWTRAWENLCAGIKGYAYRAHAASDSRETKPAILASEINALPEHVRRYIMWLETDADPAGTLQNNFRLTEENAALRLLVASDSRGMDWYVLVPREETEEMYAAGQRVFLEMNIADPVAHVWDAMLAAAPAPPAAASGELANRPFSDDEIERAAEAVWNNTSGKEDKWREGFGQETTRAYTQAHAALLAAFPNGVPK